MSTLRLGLPRLLAASALTVFVCHCGGSSAYQSSTDGSDTASPPDLLGPPPALRPLSVEIELDEPVEVAFERIRQAYRDAGIETFDPRLAYATSPVYDFAWYFTVNDPDDPFERTNHVFFVVTKAWDESRTRDFLLTYVVLAGAPPSEAGRFWFHFYSAEPPPYAVRYIFSNTIQGAIEAAMLTELGTVRWSPSDMPAIVARSREILARHGIAYHTGATDACPAVLDALYASLGHPPADGPDDVFGTQYLPEGTLAAIGAIVGEHIRSRAADEIRWEADGDSVYPRLRVDGPRPGVLRPIQMMIELYLADADVLPSDYCERMLHNVIGG